MANRTDESHHAAIDSIEAHRLLCSAKMRAHLIALFALVLLPACSTGPLDRKRLHAAIADLAAVAAESRMLVVQDQRGLPGSYVEGQRADLTKRGTDALGELDRGVDDARLDPVRREAAGIGFQLTKLVTTAREPDALGSCASQLKLLAAESSP